MRHGIVMGKESALGAWRVALIKSLIYARKKRHALGRRVAKFSWKVSADTNSLDSNFLEWSFFLCSTSFIFRPLLVKVSDPYILELHPHFCRSFLSVIFWCVENFAKDKILIATYQSQMHFFCVWNWSLCKFQVEFVKLNLGWYC